MASLPDEGLQRTANARMNRSELIQDLVSRILAVKRPHPVRVGIDGVDAAGKTTLADEIAPLLEDAGRQAIRASIDCFHNGSAVRYRRGRESPEGYYFDSFDHVALSERLLQPLGPRGTRRFQRAAFDYRNDTPIDAPLETAEPDAVLVFDGIFLHRPELRSHWDFSVFLDVDFAVTIPRAMRRDDATPESEVQRIYDIRYVPGQRLYLSAVRPKARASLLIDNADPANPTILRAV